MNFLKNIWIKISLITFITIGIYYNSLNVPFIFDDARKIVKNPDIKKLSNIKTKLIYPYNKKYKIFNRNDPSRPLTYLTFILNYHFGKLNTFGYHLFNILIHIFNSILIFLLTKKILFYTYKESADILPLFVALLFAVHPINTNVVTYIFARSGSLATMFYFLSLLFFIKTFEGNKKIYILSLFSCVLSFLSKPTAVSFPAIVLIFDYIFLSNYKIQKVIEKKYYHIPFWFILIGYLLFRYSYLGGIGDIETDVSTRVPGYAYLLTQTNIIVKYIKSLVIPTRLSIDHSINLARTIFEFRILYSILLIAGIFLFTWKSYKKKTDWSKIIVFGILWFFITLSPTSSFFPTTSYMDDKRVYLPGFGAYLLIALLYFRIFCRGITYNKKSRQILLCLMGIHVSILGAATINRNRIYQSPFLIWQDVVAQYPTNKRAYVSLGALYHNRHEFNKALQAYKKALELDPRCTLVYNDLGNLYHVSGEYDKAFQAYEKALQINPNDARAYNGLGLLYHALKKYDNASGAFQKAVELYPDFADAHYNLGYLYMKLNKDTQAIQEYRRTIALDPDFLEAHKYIGVLYWKQKKFKEARQEYLKILELEQSDVYVRRQIGE